MQEFDAVVIGGGPAGYECAIRLSQNGLKTALLEEDELGGTCLNRGCIPTKTLLHAAEAYHTALNSAYLGVAADAVRFDYPRAIQHKDKVVKQLRAGIAFLEKNHGVSVFRGSARVRGFQKVQIGEETLSCTYLIIATGSSPARIPVPGIDLPGVMDSTALLDMKTCPERLVIVGGGVIGIEFASFFSRLGVRVKVVEMMDRILSTMDDAIVTAIEDELRAGGVEFCLGARVSAIEPGLQVKCEVDGRPVSLEGDAVLIAGGRVPRTRELGLETIGVNLTAKGFVETDDLCRTNIRNVFAIGDVNGKTMLAHAASAQGIMVADIIAGKPYKCWNPDHVPACVYCMPEAAMVGMTEARARSAARNAGTGVFSLSGNGRASAMGENKGFVKIVFDRDTDEILGFHMVGPFATELVSEAVAVMECEGTVSELCSAIHPHPSVSEAIMEAARVCHKCSVNAPKQ